MKAAITLAVARRSELLLQPSLSARSTWSAVPLAPRRWLWAWPRVSWVLRRRGAPGALRWPRGRASPSGSGRVQLREKRRAGTDQDLVAGCLLPRPHTTPRTLASARVVVCAGAPLEGRKLRVAVVGGGPAGQPGVATGEEAFTTSWRESVLYKAGMSPWWVCCLSDMLP